MRDNPAVRWVQHKYQPRLRRIGQTGGEQSLAAAGVDGLFGTASLPRGNKLRWLSLRPKIHE